MHRIVNSVIAGLIVSAGLASGQGCVGCQKCVETVEIVEMEEMIVVGISTFVSPEHNPIPALWERFMKRCSEIKPVANKGVMLGVSYGMEPLAESGQFTFFHVVGCIVNNAKNIPEGMIFKTIPKHKYARFQHKGKLDGLMKTYNCIYGEWFPIAPYEYDADACEFEWYDERFIPDSEQSVLDIYVPIKDKPGKEVKDN